VIERQFIELYCGRVESPDMAQVGGAGDEETIALEMASARVLRVVDSHNDERGFY
jgi:hypothetical protein